MTCSSCLEAPMPVPIRTITVAETADQIGVAPSRVRALIASGVLSTSAQEPDSVPVAEVAELTRRGVVRAVDVAAVEGAVDRALRRRLPALLEAGLGAGLAPLSREVATALADVRAERRAARSGARAGPGGRSRAVRSPRRGGGPTRAAGIACCPADGAVPPPAQQCCGHRLAPTTRPALPPTSQHRRAAPAGTAG